jgi:AcrR family transcriptional regulator
MSAAVISYHPEVSRWEPNARGRLVEAAQELYLERGYDQVTVAEIAQRAGLTERTFFRHFADKREVLFGGARELQEQVAAVIRAAPESATPTELIETALTVSTKVFTENRAQLLRRGQIVAANPELREREVVKGAAMVAAMTTALRERGLPEPAASLTAELGSAVFRIATGRWLADPEPPDLSALIKETLAELKAVAAR